VKTLAQLYCALAWVLFLGWFVGLNILSSLPGSDLPRVFFFPFADKVFHFSAFFAGGCLLFLALRSTPHDFIRRLPHVLLAFLVVGGIGLLDELRQLLTPGRDGADPWDMLANVSGALFGAYCTSYLYGRFVRLFGRA
jgi:VanZ family protein